MALLNEARLKTIKASLSATYPEIKAKSVTEILTDELNSARTKDSFDVFMSHHFVDHDSILTLTLLFKSWGYSVYVDWIIDHGLNRKNVTKENVETLKLRMRQSRSLLFVTSRTSSESKWMPWELGFHDGHKQRAAILPVLDASQTASHYQGQEYLSIYPYVTIRPRRSNNSETLWVQWDDDTYVLFTDWINGQDPSKHQIE